MKRGVLVLVLLIFIISGCAEQRESKGIGPEGIEGPHGGPQCKSLQAGEWMPQQGECNNQEMQNKCNEFCQKHPDCCPGWSAEYVSSEGGPGQTLLPWPSEEEVASLTRNYPSIIKAINEGPLIYNVNTAAEIISDEMLDKMKESGFNTVQVLLIGKWEEGKIVFNEVNNRAILNDIVAIKKKGMAVWVALDMVGGPPVPGVYIGDSYEQFKSAFLNLVEISAPLMEKYKVEYLTVNNEADKFFNDQIKWASTKEQINEYLIDFYPATNELARKSFNGKLINKITGPEKHTSEFLTATFKNVDIAGVDVGPYIGDKFDMSIYQEGLNAYQFYATKAEEAGVPWMNAEYWISNFAEATPSQKEHQLECVNAAIDAYSKTTPKGQGFTYNEYATFSWEPNGEKTRAAIKEFLQK